MTDTEIVINNIIGWGAVGFGIYLLYKKLKNKKKPELDEKMKAKLEVQETEIKNTETEYFKELSPVFNCIKEKDWVKAKDEFDKLGELKTLPKIQGLIISKIVEEVGEEPLYVQSPGNDSFQAIKIIINLKVAHAAAEATMLALKKLQQGKDKFKE
jgi:hypothetical protein